MKQPIHPNQIDDILFSKHKDSFLQYNLIGYTIHAGLHFNMRTNYDGIWYQYDGMDNLKIRKAKKCSDITLGRINCALYVLTEISNYFRNNYHSCFQYYLIFSNKKRGDFDF